MPRDDGEAEAFINLEWNVAGKVLRERLAVPVEPTRPLRMLPMLRTMAERVVERAVERAEQDGRQVSCRAGCGACCRQLVPISPTEAHHLRELVAGLADDHRARVLRRFADALGRFEQAGMLDTLLHPESLEQRRTEAFSLQYFDIGVPCPFLEDESCSIHPERPIACREYLVSSDPENCDAPTRDTIERLPIAGAVSQALGRVDCGGPHGDRSDWVPLVAALRWSEQNPDTRPLEPATAIFARVINELKPKTSKAKQKARRRQRRR